MGLLSLGTPLSWPASEPYRHKVVHDGVTQFLSVYHATKHFKDHDLKWGDEVEYLLVHFDIVAQKSTLLTRAPQLLNILQRDEHAQPDGSSVPVLWRPEYSTWMIEGTPGVPYRCYAADLINVQRNMALRRTEIHKVLGPDESVLTLTAFPLMGCASFTTPPSLPFGPVSRSFFISDQAINPHPRFPTLTRNIRHRRGRKIHIEVPLFIDVNTQIQQSLIPHNPQHLALLRTVSDQLVSQGKQNHPDFALLEEGLQANTDGTIVMDCAAFGMGCACLQVTIQGRDLSETRYLYDQLAVMAPLMLALTAATPILRGLLADTDVRWDVISASMDDRSLEESQSGKVPKARYSSIDCFLSCREKCRPELYNDIPIPINQDAYKRLVDGGVDHLLSQHIAHLFIRDPLVIFEEKVDQDNTTSTDHFENIQSTNWNTVRFKPPPPQTDIGWRTEFRSMEVGLTDFENAAFSVFVVLLSRVILAFNLNFYVPMSKVDENMESAHARDAVNSRKFYFRKNVFKTLDGSEFLCDCGHIHKASLVGGHAECEDINEFCSLEDKASSGDWGCGTWELMSLDEIFNGKAMHRNGQPEGFTFPGIIPLMRGYLDALQIESSTRVQLFKYLDFVSDRASGEICTTANYMREFVANHDEYCGDSVVNEKVCFDLMTRLQDISDGKDVAEGLLGRFAGEMRLKETDTPNTMMARMQKKFEGDEGVTLHGSSMPRSALAETIRSIASYGG